MLNVFESNFYNIIIFDNDIYSNINLIDERSYSNIKYNKLDKNLGFAKANNLGAKQSNAEYLCFLNPDTIITEDFITPIIKFISQNNNVGACAPMLVYENGEYQSSTGIKMGILYEFLEAFYLINIIRKINQNKYLKLINSNQPVQVNWVSGACFIIKKSVFDESGGFTEDYFLNYEDIDLCNKLEKAGYNNYYFPYIKCIHLDHKSFDRNFELLVYSRYQSRLVYAKLHYNYITRFLVRLIHIFGILIRITVIVFFYSGDELKSRYKGYFKSLKLYFGINSKIHYFYN
jgi:GT2 family glycosyltransferase